MIDQETKEFVKKTVMKLGESLNTQLNEKVFAPMAQIIAEIKDLKGTGTDNGGGNTIVQSIIDPSINMLPIHLKMTMGFAFTFDTLVNNNKDSNEIANRVLEEYGTVMGKAFLEAMEEAVSDTKKNKLKDKIKEVRKIMDGTT